MRAGAAGCAMDRPRLLLPLLLLLGVSASWRGAHSLSQDRNPMGSGFPEGNSTELWGPRCWGWRAGEELRCQDSQKSV